MLPQARLERLFAERHSLVWRTLRRLGLSPAEAADTTRRVFQEASKRLGGALRSQERTKLLSLALRYAFTVDRFAVSEVRTRPPLARREKVRAGVFARDTAPAHAACVDLMDRVLSHMPRPAATVFILFELEGLSLSEVAEVLSLAPEAARQTLVHARAEFKSIVAALSLNFAPPSPSWPMSRMVARILGAIVVGLALLILCAPAGKPASVSAMADVVGAKFGLGAAPRR